MVWVWWSLECEVEVGLPWFSLFHTEYLLFRLDALLMLVCNRYVPTSQVLTPEEWFENYDG